jgi:catechol 2,3-dioxygenase-like lactoylglutathione lyase family enzyme
MIAGGRPVLAVSDVDRAVRFYVETMGFKLVARTNDVAEVDAGGGLVIGLARAGDGPGPGTRGSVVVCFEVNQPIGEVVEVLANRGVRFEGGVRGDGAGKVAGFVDPDGNGLRLVEAGTQ